MNLIISKKIQILNSSIYYNTNLRFPQKERETLFTDKIKGNTPGPNSYNLDKFTVTNKYKIAENKNTFGKSDRELHKPRNTPGPGAYESSKNDFGNNGNKYTISKKERKTIGGLNNSYRESVPGPGRYQLNSFPNKNKVPNVM